jgi:holliday junction DNA helicase RuvB
MHSVSVRTKSYLFFLFSATLVGTPNKNRYDGRDMAIEEHLNEGALREIAPEAQANEQQQELTLRPQTLADFIGQPDLRANLEIFIAAAKTRNEPLEHLLLYGNPGLGKTTLAHIVGQEMGAQVRVTSGPALERVGDLAAILSNLQRGDILFIDEIHRMNKSIEEVLYPAMEDFALDVVVGKGPTARTLRLNLEPFTIIGATTRLSLLSAPLRDRFGTVFQLDFYNEPDMCRIVSRSANILGFVIDEQSAQTIAKRARKTPRIANRLLKRVRDFAQVKHAGAISPAIANAALDLLAIDPLGLDSADRRILLTLIEKFQGGPVGLGTLAAATQEEQATIEEVYEPFLLQLGFLERTTRGRIATPRAYEHLHIANQTDPQR